MRDDHERSKDNHEKRGREPDAEKVTALVAMKEEKALAKSNHVRSKHLDELRAADKLGASQGGSPRRKPPARHDNRSPAAAASAREPHKARAGGMRVAMLGGDTENSPRRNPPQSSVRPIVTPAKMSFAAWTAMCNKCDSPEGAEKGTPGELRKLSYDEWRAMCEAAASPDVEAAGSQMGKLSFAEWRALLEAGSPQLVAKQGKFSFAEWKALLESDGCDQGVLRFHLAGETDAEDIDAEGGDAAEEFLVPDGAAADDAADDSVAAAAGLPEAAEEAVPGIIGYVFQTSTQEASFEDVGSGLEAEGKDPEVEAEADGSDWQAPGPRLLARVKVNLRDTVAVFRACTTEDFADVDRLLPQGRLENSHCGSAAYLLARLEVNGGLNMGASLLRVSAGEQSMEEAVGPAVGCLMATFGTNTVTSSIFRFEDPVEIRCYSQDKRMELFGLQVPPFPRALRSMAVMDAREMQRAAAEPITISWSPAEQMTISLGLLYAMCDHAAASGIRCGFFASLPQLLAGWMEAGVKMELVKTAPTLICPPNAPAYNYYRASTVAWFTVDEVKAGLEGVLNMVR